DGGRVELSHEQFDEQYTGIALSFTPTDAFRRDRSRFHLPWLLGQIGWRGAWQASAAILGSVAGAGAIVAAAVAISAANVPMLLAAMAVLAVTAALGSVASTSLKRDLVVMLIGDVIRRFRAMKPAFFAYRIPDRLVEVVHSVEAVSD